MKAITHLCIMIGVSALLAGGNSRLMAQSSYLDEPGIPFFTTSFPVEHGFINLANGNLHIEIPIATYPQRGNIKALNARLVYDSRFWTVATDQIQGAQYWAPNGMPSVGVSLDGGFRFITGGEPGNASSSQSSQVCGYLLTGVGSVPQYRTTYSNFQYQEPNGTIHRAPSIFKLYSSPPPPCQNEVATGSSMAVDHSGYKFVVNQGYITMYHPDGTVEPSPVSGPGAPWLQDTNGNYFTFSKGQDPTINNVIDNLGRTPVVVTRSGSQVFLDYLCEQGCNPGAGDRARVIVNIEPVQWATLFNQVGVGEYTGGTRHAVQSIVFPDGSSYSFLYDSYGMITDIALPSGGHVSYGYSNFADYQGNVNRWVTSRVADGQTWSFSPALLSCPGTPPCPMQVTVTTPPYNDGALSASDTHVYDFAVQNDGVLSGSFNIQIQLFRGAASGTSVATEIMDYGFSPPCPALLGPSQGIPEPIRKTLVWPTGSGALSKKAEYCYDGYSNLTVIKEWDYQPNGNFAATPDREIDNIYKIDSTYINANILRLLQSTTTKDSAGNQASQTTYGYDEYSTPGLALQPSGITVQHNTPSGPRGNLTSVTRWLNTSTSPVVSTAAWYDTGEVYQTSDPLKHNSTINYDSTGAYPSTHCNALNQCSYTSYDFNTGLLTTSTDANGSALGDPAHTTTYTYDFMLRPLCTNYPDGGQTCLGYPSVTEVDRTQKITSALPPDLSSTVLDGLGRLSQTQHSTPNGVAKVATTYDPLGRVFSISNPYFATTDPTYGVIQTLYDALSRPVKITRQDGSVVNTAYSVNTSIRGLCETITDEAGKPRRTCHNGFGELTEVDEPGDSFPGADANGNLTINGTLRSVVTGGSPATAGSGSVTISGAEQCFTQPPPGGGCTPPMICGIVNLGHGDWDRQYLVTPPAFVQTICDSGTVTITVNGHSDSVPYGSGSTTASIASALVNAINGDGVAFVTAVLSGSTVLLTARTTGSGTNYSVSSSVSFDNVDFGAASFSTSNSGATLTGGSDAVSGTTTYDSGTASLTVGSFTGPAVAYSPTQNITSAALAQALATAFTNAPGAPATAMVSPSGSTISITYKTVGTAGNVAATVTSTPSNASLFPGGSFSGSTSLAGGLDPEGPSLDFNYYVTQYSYDALGNLLNVTQKGDPAVNSSSEWRIRYFTYDSLSRLLTADNPESGHISYTYDNDGELVQKISPAPNPNPPQPTQAISYCYDPLHRLTDKSYTPQPPVIGQPCTLTGVVEHQAYDSGTNGIGHLTSLADQAGSGSYSYDNMGRVKSEQRTLTVGANSFIMGMSYDYNLNGSITALHYPSGAVVTYAPWNNGTVAVSSPQAAVDSGNSINYATSGNYGADGQITGLVSGKSPTFAGITNAFIYNPRLQPCRMVAGTGALPGSCLDLTNHGNILDLGYDFHLNNGNNGNVYGITNYKDATRNQTFTYDQLNRLTSAQNAGTNCAASTVNGRIQYWGNAYGYDAWGNLLQKSVTKCLAENLSVTVAANNQITTAGYSYDAAGNMTSNATDGVTATYDAENRITGAASFTYTYDADGNRVKKSNGTTGTLYWYMTPGIVAESDLLGNLLSEYVFFNGQRVARRDFPSGSVAYYFSDHLKTASVITDSAGNIKSESDYYPWGGELQFVNNDSNHYKFTGKERDTESGLDYFGARYYSNSLGRFAMPDEPFVDQNAENPQSWNLYSYTRNNPTTFVDVDGRDVLVCVKKADGGQQCETVSDGTYDKARRDEKNSGIKSPKTGRTGDITCGGSVCGHVTYIPTPSRYGADGINPGFLGPGDLVLFGAGRSLLGLGARETVGTVVTGGAAAGAGRGLLTATEGVLLSHGTKAAARDIIEGMAEGAQKASLKRAIAAAGSQAKVTVQELGDGSVRVMINRAGTNGGQTIIKTVAADGSSKTVQVAVDGAGNLVHYDPKN